MKSIESKGSIRRFALVVMAFATGIGVGWYWQRPAGGPSIRFVAEKNRLFANRHSGYLDGSGRMAIRAQFESAFEFQEGRAFVKSGGRWAVIDLAGNMKYPPAGVEYTLSRFSQGLSPARSSERGRQLVGMVDYNGTWVIEPEYDVIRSEVGNGRIGVIKDKNYGFINRRGEVAIDLEFDDIEEFKEGSAFAKRGELWGIIDLAGDWIVEPKFADVGDRGSGLAAVQVGDNWHVIDMRGRIFLRPFDSRPYIIGEGLIADPATGRGEYGIITIDGHRLVEQRWSWIGPFSDGLAFVSGAENTGYIDYSGELVISFDSADVLGLPFINGLAKVRFLTIGSQHGFEGYINREGDWVHRRDHQ